MTAAIDAPHHVVGAPNTSRCGEIGRRTEGIDGNHAEGIEILRGQLGEHGAGAVRRQRLGRRVGLVQRSLARRFVEVPVVDDRARFLATHRDHPLGHLAEPGRVEDLELDDEPDPLAVAHAPDGSRERGSLFSAGRSGHAARRERAGPGLLTFAPAMGSLIKKRRKRMRKKKHKKLLKKTRWQRRQQGK